MMEVLDTCRLEIERKNASVRFLEIVVRLH